MEALPLSTTIINWMQENISIYLNIFKELLDFLNKSFKKNKLTNSYDGIKRISELVK